ncbi:MAG: transcription factor FapR [Synergistaceae bacterium]|nr:transcription factor FapR [Synergistaceae bacterium]MBQ7067768.1 transcription factor FapR [Synergistaceae bacterium]MBR0080378.1 transcription factor FapR [Synergistaceae bacterium]MBR0233146.1 transcription factor FapR [Synergistaceae bacterium]MBR0254040.1 transcription factor FapR [Synergistaceae bacterium]
MLKSEKTDRKSRHDILRKIISENPMINDYELAEKLNVSISTIRLDRALLGVPELRERIKTMAQNAVSKLQSLSPSEVIGELLELEPDKWALSVLRTAKEMAFRFTDIVSDNYIYSQASSIAVAVIEAANVIIDSMRGEYKGHAHVGDVLIARAKVGVNHDGKKIVSVRTRVGDKEIFVGRFILEIIE